jgi:hypothetical protein
MKAPFGHVSEVTAGGALAALHTVRTSAAI